MARTLEQPSLPGSDRPWNESPDQGWLKPSTATSHRPVPAVLIPAPRQEEWSLQLGNIINPITWEAEAEGSLS